MKNSLYLLFIYVFLTACSSKSSIITSKNEALKKKIYTTNHSQTVIPEKKTVPTEVIVQKVEPKIEIKKEKVPEYKSEVLPEIIDDEFVINPNTSHESEEQIDENFDMNYEENPSYNSTLSEKVLSEAIDNIGSRYRTGGTSKSGFDCSGLMIASFGKFDIKLPRTSNGMSRFGKKINPKNAQKGDLIFFRTLGSRKINHVGMVVEVNEDEIKFVHSSIKRGVIISTTKEGYYKKTFAQVNRVLE